jgi:hypothetical protein
VKAFILDRYKKKGALPFGGMPEPALQDDDVLVEIHAAGVTFPFMATVLAFAVVAAVYWVWLTFDDRVLQRRTERRKNDLEVAS